MSDSRWLRNRSEKSVSRSGRIPLSMYVLWHPEFAEGPLLARTIADWCGGGAVDIRAVGLGIPVHFRSERWCAANVLRAQDSPPEQPPGGTVAGRPDPLHSWRRPVQLDDADHNVFLPLVDDHMVDDPSWRRDLVDLARAHHACRISPVEGEPCVHLVPIQATSAWPRLPEQVSAIQALLLRRWTESLEQCDEQRTARWKMRIRRLVTQALVRLLRGLRDPKLPTQIFLSHAKVDRAFGPGIAEQLRDVAAGYGQIDVFYDENATPSGDAWKDSVLQRAANTAGFIAILSDRYATRYWCRREVQQARTPVQLTPELATETRGCSLWTVRPCVVVVAMSGEWSRLVGELGTVPAIMWRPEVEGHASAILDELFREAFIAEFQLLCARQLIRQYCEARDRHGRPIAFLTWTPDVSTLIRLRREAGTAWANNTLVVYPGHGFLPTEEADLAGVLGDDVEFCSFEQFSDCLAARSNGKDRPVRPMTFVPSRQRSTPIIALSTGDADDLAELGYDAPGNHVGSSHVDLAVLRVCRPILQANVRIAFGGSLRHGASFTQFLHDMVAASRSTINSATKSCNATDVADAETPLENLVALPLGAEFTVRVRAEAVGLCRYHFLGEQVPPGATPEQRAVIAARALSDVRRAIARRSCMTIAFAGKRWGFSGIMPGVAEEVLCSMEAAGPLDCDPDLVRVLLIGEYGGAVREMVRYLLNDHVLPDALTLAGQEMHGSNKPGTMFRASPQLREEAVKRYQALEKCLTALRKVAQMPPATRLKRLGITVGDWLEIMRASRIDVTRRLVKERVLPAVAEYRGDSAVPKNETSRRRLSAGRMSKQGSGRRQRGVRVLARDTSI